MKNSFVAYGESMSPLINKGDLIYVEKGGVEIGDVVLFIQKRRAIVHRVIFKIGKRVWTKGDSVFILDDELREADILGKVYLIEGNKKEIYLKNVLTGITQRYFLIRSIILYIIPGGTLKMFLSKILGGRRFLVRLIS